jgi:acyl carrier protein
MDDAAIRPALRTYIARELMRDESYEIEDDEGIITGGLIDSFSLAELAVYVEQEYNVVIPNTDLTVAKMDTLNQIVARVLKG